MAIIETLVDHMSVRSVLVLVPGLLVTYLLYVAVGRPAWKELQLARLPGVRAPKIRTVAPFGEHAFVEIVRCLGRHQLMSI